jgi:hypothetical protein
MKRGRPPFKITQNNRHRVELLVAVGETQDFIARAIGCSAVTLRAHFASELEFGAARIRAEIISMLFRASERGNVSALKYLESLMRARPG